MSPEPAAQVLHATRSRAWKGQDDAAISSAMSHGNKQRNPPPALFLAPSPAASHVSLPSILAPGADALGSGHARKDRANLEVDGSQFADPIVTSNARSPGRLPTGGSGRSADRTDALWAEMQARLEEVELSASGGTHVFGPDHDEKLEKLRTAQIGLARAWARSEADDAIGATLRGRTTSTAGEEVRNLGAAIGEGSKPATADGNDAGKSTVTSASGRPTSSGGGVERLGAKLEEETESDILLARKRREANDQYFQRVNHGVLDVVRKLEEVAVAMREVEQESKEVWDEDGSSPPSSRI